MEVETNNYGTNKAIKAHILSDDKMREIGFTDYLDGYWYFGRNLINEISFGVTIKKDCPQDLEIDILNEDFCQPYDYQYMIENGNAPRFAFEIREKVELYMDKLHKAGVLSGHNKYDYI